MKYRVAMWAIVGFVVAGFWALFARATFPSAGPMRNVRALVYITCPIAIAGHHAIGLYESLAANAVTYALVGLIVETLRKQLRHAQ